MVCDGLKLGVAELAQMGVIRCPQHAFAEFGGLLIPDHADVRSHYGGIVSACRVVTLRPSWRSLSILMFTLRWSPLRQRMASVCRRG